MVSKEDKSIVLGSTVFILMAFVLTVSLKYNELMSFVVAGIAGVIVGLTVNKLQGSSESKGE